MFAAPIAALYLFLLTLATGYSVLFALLPIAAAVFCILLILLRPGRARRNVGIVFAGVVRFPPSAWASNSHTTPTTAT